MAGHPARYPDADCSQFVRSDPGAGQAGNPHRLDAEHRRGRDHHGFEIAHVPVDIAAVRTQIEDGITNQLTGTVVGDVAAAAGFEQRHAGVFEGGFGREHVRAIVPDLGPERDDRRVFEEEELIGNLAGLARLDQPLLQRQAVGVGDDAEAADFERP